MHIQVHWAWHAISHADLAAMIMSADAAYDADDRESAWGKLSEALAMAARLGDEEALRRLRRLVDVVDAETGLVSLKEFARGGVRELYSTRLSLPSTSLELAGSVSLSRATSSVRLLVPDTARLRLPRFDPPPALLARVRCDSDEPVTQGQSVRVSFNVIAGRPLASLAEPVRLRILLDALPADVSPVSRVAILTTDRVFTPVEFDVVPEREGLLPLVFRVYRDSDSYLLLEVRARLPVERAEVPT